MYHQALISPSRWGLLRRAISFVLVWSLASGTVFIPGVWAATFYVNDDTGDDGRDAAAAQNSATPWKTITRAINEVTLAAGDKIDVAAGIYNSALGESFPMTLVDGVAIAGADPNTTTITGPVASTLFVNNDTPLASGTTLSGFTLTHEALDLANLGMSFVIGSADMAPEIFRNSFVGVSDYGQGVKISDSDTGARSFTGVFKDGAFSDLQRGIEAIVSLSGTPADVSPTIRNNTFNNNQSSIRIACENAYGGTASPVIEDNQITWGSAGISLNFGNKSGHGATMTGLISGNTITEPRNAISLSLGTISLSSSSDVATYAPTVLNNIVEECSSGFGGAISIDLYGPKVGTVDLDLTIAGNTITNPNANGIDFSLTNFTSGSSASADMDVTITNNSITEAEIGVLVDLNSTGSYLNGNVDITIAGNTITDSDDRGIDISLSSFEYSEIDFVLTVQGNTVTNSGSDGIYLDNSSQTTFADSRADILANVVDGSGDRGISIESRYFPSVTPYVKVTCNTVINSISDGIYLYADSHAPNPDFGGGDLSSPGRNTLMGNGGYDFYNDDSDLVDAHSNWWGTTDDATIDAHIYDNEEDPSKGAVEYSGPLSAAPTVSATATLVDALEVDLSPTGPSLGDTIRYTATLAGTGECACASALFSVPMPSNGYFVDDSLTPSRGIVINDTINALHSDLIVGLGALEAGEVVTITWDVIAGAGCTMYSQGTLSCQQLGDLTTDDPDVNGSNVPTYTLLGTDLVITKTDGLDTAAPGEEISYTIVVTSTCNAENSTVTDTFPAAFTDVNWTCTPTAGNACGSGSGNINDTVAFRAGGILTYTATGVIDSLFSGDLVNTATVAPPAGLNELDPSNNSASDTTDVIGIEELLFADGFETGDTMEWSNSVP